MRRKQDTVGDGGSILSFLSKPSWKQKATKTAAAYPSQVNQDSFLNLQAEYRSLKQKKMRRKAKIDTQLARTEEAAKRILIRCDQSARGGTAQQLLEAEAELVKVKAEKTELENELERVRKQVEDFKHQAVMAKKKLNSALQDQRRLAQQVGKLEAAKQLGLKNQGPCANQKLSTQPGSSSPRFTASKFARQQEELAKAREEIEHLKLACLAAEDLSQQKAQNLVHGLESEIVELARKLQTYEQQLSALGVAIPGPYDDGFANSQPQLAASFGLIPSALLWVLQDWQYNGEMYLLDPLNNGVYSSSRCQSFNTQTTWPCPVGLICAGQLLATPPGQALRLFVSLSEALANSKLQPQSIHQILMQAASSVDSATLALEEVVQHRVAPSDVEVLLACLGTDTAAVLQSSIVAASLQGICCLAEAIAAGNCRQLTSTITKVEKALEQRSEEAVWLLLGRTAPARMCYLDLIHWFRAIAPGLNSEEIWAGMLWLRTWDLYAHGALQPSYVLRAFRFGAVWRIRPGSTSSLKQSLQIASNVKQLLEAGQKVAQLEDALREQVEAMKEQEKEIASLSIKLGQAESLLVDTQAAADKQQAERSAEGQGTDQELAALRLKYLKAKSSLESVTASNARLIKELDSSKAHLNALQHHTQLRKSPGKEDGAVGPQTSDAPPVCGGSTLATGGFELQQELTKARHAMAQLQIELDAAQSKLAIYRAHPHKSSSGSGEILAIRAKQPYKQQCQVERLGTKARRKADGGHLPDSGSQFDDERPMESRAFEIPEVLRGLAANENIVELHIHDAALEHFATGPQGMTFLTIDFYQHETQMTPIVEGSSPLYYTTCQFVVSVDKYLVNFLKESSIRVELHTCKAGPGGAVEYVTMGSGSIPLQQLLSRSPGVRLGQQQCKLVDAHGQSCGTLQYALCALRPLCNNQHDSKQHQDGNNQPVSAGSPYQQQREKQQQQGRQPVARDATEGAHCPAGSTGAWIPAQRPGVQYNASSCKFKSQGGFEETYIRCTRTESPTPPSPTHATHRLIGHREDRGSPSRGEARCSTLGPHQAECISGIGQHQIMEQARTTAACPLGSAPQTKRLKIEVQGCSDLRVLNSSRSQPYVSIKLTCANEGCDSRQGSTGPASRLGWLLETRPARGTHPTYGECTSVAVGRGDVLEAVVFDAGVDARRDAGGGIIGAAEIPIESVYAMPGGHRAVPLVQPSLGRHAGLLTLKLAWE